MGASSSKDGVPVVWGATTHRGKKGGRQKKEYSEKQLQQLDQYLQKEIARLRAHIRQLRESDAGWAHEFGRISKAGLGSSAMASASLENTNKNRYKNIVAYDHSRVKITPTKFNFHNDYVNANFVNGYKKQRAYIACQGPVPDSFPNFWQMVWEQSVNTIVMVASEVEAGRLKCHRYWPELNQTVAHGMYEVTTMKEEATRNNIHRSFRLKSLDTQQHYQVEHLQFILWPDHGVPNTSGEILAFRDDVYRLHDPDTPLVVHCSAGVGRTGTYIAMDRLICAAESLEPTLDVEAVVHDLRCTRNFMVQTMIQYGFVYLSVHEALIKGHKQVKQGLAKLEELTQQQMQDELEGITEDIDEVLEEVQAYGNERMNQEVSHLKEQTEGTGQGANKVQTRVSVVKRMKSFISAVQEEKRAERATTSVEADWEDLQSRIKTLSEQASDAFKQQYSSAASAWQQEDEYHIATELTPIQSRLAALAAQQEAYKLRGPEFRKQIEDDSLRQLASLKARVQNFNDSLHDVERRSQSTRKSSQAKLQSDLEDMGPASLINRLQALATPNAEGTSFGRVLAAPVTASRIEKKKLPAQDEMLEKDEEEEETCAEASKQTARQEEAPKTQFKYQLKAEDASKAVQGEVVQESDPQMTFVALKAAKPKEAQPHPMIAHMAQHKQVNPKKDKKRNDKKKEKKEKGKGKR